VKFGLAAEDVARIRAVFEKYSPIEKVILYGSRAKGSHRQGSDIDVTLFGPLTLTILNQIRNDLDDLNLPYTFDLSIYSQIDNADLLEHIRRVGTLFFERDSSR